MTTTEVKRKLTAILSADVKGYSRLMGEDEEGTIRTLSTYKEAMSNLIQQLRGRVVDAPGDNLLAEFASVVDAVRCAVDIQKELKNRNAQLPENRRMEFRIGVNLGDVVEEGEKIFGDGVNIAARLESLSDAGGICISGTTFDHIRNKLSLGYEYLGEQTVKNITIPVRAYKVLMEPEAAGMVIGEKKAKPRQWQMATIGLVILLIAVVAAVVIWKLYTPSTQQLEVASKEKMAFPLPDEPSIAVLPFVNMSEDLKQEFLCDGITEGIITALSKVPRLFVIARTSTFTYKGKPVKVQQIAENLGVRYVLEGGVQRSADRIRVTAQLIDALTGHHIWAGRYDRNLKDIFAVQDDVTSKILTAMRLKLVDGEQALAHEKEKENLDVYLKVLEGKSYVERSNIEGNNLARRMAEEAIALDSRSTRANVLLAMVYTMDYWLGSTKSPREAIEKAIELTQKSLAIDDSHAHAHGLLSHLYSIKREHEKAIAEGEKAVGLEPSGADVHTWYGMSLNYAGRPEEAIPLFKKAIRLNPFGPTFQFLNLGSAYRMTGRFEEAVLTYKKALERSPDNILAHIHLAATFSMMGREQEARAEAAEVLKINPKFSLDYFKKTLPYKDQSVIDKLMDALRKAGLPEKPSATIPPSAEVAPKEKVTPPPPEKVTKPAPPSAPKIEVASKEKMAFPLPDVPSIAVMPFVNMSGDPKQEFFSDGITEEITTALSKVRNLFVISRQSTFSYKGKPVKVKQVAEELGVQYVLEGSVQRSGDRIRINAQLIDALTGGHIWAEKYDRDLTDLFALQDEITTRILTAIRVKLTEGEQASIAIKDYEKYFKGKQGLECYLKILEGFKYAQGHNIEDARVTRRIAEEAIAMCPEAPMAYGLLGYVHHLEYWLGSGKSPQDSIEKGIEMVQKVIALDDSNSSAYAHGLLGTFYVVKREYDKAIAEGERSIALAPGAAGLHIWYAMNLNFAGRPEDAIPVFQKAIRLTPIAPTGLHLNFGVALRMTGKFEEAVSAFRKAIQRAPDNIIAHINLAATYNMMGRERDARTEADEVIRINPKFSLDVWAKRSIYKDQSETNKMVDALRKAGLK